MSEAWKSVKLSGWRRKRVASTRTDLEAEALQLGIVEAQRAGGGERQADAHLADGGERGALLAAERLVLGLLDGEQQRADDGAVGVERGEDQLHRLGAAERWRATSARTA